MFVWRVHSWAGKSAAVVPFLMWSDLLPPWLCFFSPSIGFCTFILPSSCSSGAVLLSDPVLFPSSIQSHKSLPCPCCTAILYMLEENVMFKILILSAGPPKFSHFKVVCEHLGQTAFSQKGRHSQPLHPMTPGRKEIHTWTKRGNLK